MLRLLKVTQMVSSREQTGTQMGQNPTSGCFFFKTCLPPRYLGDILSLIVSFWSDFRSSEKWL